MMMLLSQPHGQIGQTLQSHLDQVEARFVNELRCDLDCVNTLTRHVERYRGKMLRPALVLISAMTATEAESPSQERRRAGCPGSAPNHEAQACGCGWANGTRASSASSTMSAERASGHGTDGPESTGPVEPSPQHHVLGAVVEMVHMATLVHDDILDEAEMRRGGATLNHLSGNEAAVMLGDYLISHAYHLCSSLAMPEVSRQIAGATNTICEGELLQLTNRNNWQLDEQTYFEIIQRKTARLCGMCCRLGIQLAGAPRAERQSQVAALETFGSKLGIAFQIVDDLLDLTGDPQTVGKTLGRDLEKGKLTLPLIRFLDQASPAQRTQTLSWLRDQADINPGSHAAASRERAVRDLQERLMDTEALAYAQMKAKTLVDQAKAALIGELGPSQARTVMLDMADAVLQRRG